MATQELAVAKRQGWRACGKEQGSRGKVSLIKIVLFWTERWGGQRSLQHLSPAGVGGRLGGHRIECDTHVRVRHTMVHPPEKNTEGLRHGKLMKLLFEQHLLEAY